MPATRSTTPNALTTTRVPSSSPDSQPVRSHGTTPATTPGATTRNRRLPAIARELRTALALRRTPEQDERDAGPPMPTREPDPVGRAILEPGRHCPSVVATWRKRSTPSSRSSTAIRSSAEWTSRAASLRIHRLERKEAVRHRVEGLAEVVAVGEPGAERRREPRARLERSTHASRARPDGVSIGERVPPTCSSGSTRAPSRPAPRRAAAPRPAGAWPGSRRQSTVDRARSPGITFRLRDASIIVGESVAARSGATSSAASGWSARARSSATSSGRSLADHDLEERLDLGEHRPGGSSRASASS